MEDVTQALYENTVVRKLADRFSDTPFALYLVGGCVRDAVAGRTDFSDLDFTTDATPDEIEHIVGDLGPLWLSGKRFGTIGVFVGGEKLEVTTFRGETYEPDSRKPNVTFSKDLWEDLVRRDFTVNAMAIRVDGDSPELLDPFQGATDLKDKILRTPGDTNVTILEDPLRAVRAVRFAATRGFRLSVTVETAISLHGHRLSIVAQERIMEECRKIFGQGADSVRRAYLLSKQLGINSFLFGDLGLSDLDHFDALEILGLDGYTALALMVAESIEGELTEVDAFLDDLTLPGGEKETIKKIVDCAVQLQDMQLVISMNALRRKVGLDIFRLGATIDRIISGFDEVKWDRIAYVILDNRLDAPLPVNGEDVMEVTGCEPGPFVGSALKFCEGMFCIDPSITKTELLDSLTNKGAR
jgi:hypothetical protein